MQQSNSFYRSSYSWLQYKQQIGFKWYAHKRDRKNLLFTPNVDIRTLIKDDVKLHHGIKKAAQTHNIEQFIITRLPSGAASPKSPSSPDRKSLFLGAGNPASLGKSITGAEV
jgi:hypothetical protein